MVGLLYADDRMEKARFDYGTRDRLIEFGEAFNRAYHALGGAGAVRTPARLPSATPAPPARPGKERLFRAAALASIVLALCWAVLGLLSQDTGQPEETAPASPKEQVRTVAVEVVKGLQGGHLKREFLTPRLDRELSEPRVKEWLESRKSLLSRVSVLATQAVDDRGSARVRLHQGSTAVVWQWALVKTDGDWKIDDLGGEPLP